MTKIKLKANTNSDTSSSFNDSCYGSSEMDACYQQPGNKSTGKILISSNDQYIILCKDQNNMNGDEINSSSSSSSPNSYKANMITRCQLNQRTGITKQYSTQFNSSYQNLESFHNNNEYKKKLGSMTTFNYRNMTPLNEYYL